MDDATEVLYLVLQVPLFAAGVGGLVLAALNRRRRPLACGLFAGGVVLLFGSHGLSIAVWELGLHEWVITRGWDYDTFNLAQMILYQVTATLAAGLITAAVFVREDDRGGMEPRPSGSVTGGARIERDAP